MEIQSLLINIDHYVTTEITYVKNCVLNRTTCYSIPGSIVQHIAKHPGHIAHSYLQCSLRRIKHAILNLAALLHTQK